jgi:aminocarboxymuconate-semialdehyde decarboxylase
MGTDYPFPLGEEKPVELIESAGFDASTTARLLHGTALEWLQLPKERFI